MRFRSKKTAAREREAKPVRDALVEQTGHCECCPYDPRRWWRFGPTPREMDVHEIARGSANRQKAMDKRFAVLVVCRLCHDELDSRVAWPVSRQLAALRRSRPRDYDLAAYLATFCPNAPNRVTEEEVRAWTGPKLLKEA